MKTKKPQFKTEDEEREFRATNESTENVDRSKAKPVVLPNLKPSVKTISLRLPESLLDSIKLMANKRDIPYQSLIKMLLAERIEQELKNQASAASRA